MSLSRRQFLWLLWAWWIAAWVKLLGTPNNVQAAVLKVSDWVNEVINLNPDSVIVREFKVDLSKQFPDRYFPIGLRVWVISDPHIWEFNSLSIQELRKIYSLNLDILIIAWDFMQANTTRINEYFWLLDELTNKMRWRIFAVLGNHDYKQDWGLVYDNIELLNFLKSRWITLLDNTSCDLQIKWEKVRLSWIWSVLRKRHNLLLSSPSKKIMEIFVSHEPIWFQLSWYNFDLWIAGHVHWSPSWLIDLAALHNYMLEWRFWFNEYDYKFNNWLFQFNWKTILTNSWIGRHWTDKFLTQRNIDVLTII